MSLLTPEASVNPQNPSWSDRHFNSPAGTHVGQRGVDAVSWTNAAGAFEEHAGYIGADGKLYDWRLINGAPVGADYKAWTPPAGHPFTGHVAVSRRVNNAIVFATTTTGRLYAFEITDWANRIASQHMVATLVRTDSMIGVTARENGTHVRAFVSKTDNTVGAYLYDGAVPWQAATLSAPPGPDAAPCSLLATAEGQVRASAYRTYLFCARTGGTPYNRILYYRYAAGVGSMAFGAWNSSNLPLASGGTVATGGYGLTARRRKENGLDTLEAFLLNATYVKSLLHVEHMAGHVNLGQMSELGWDGETTARPGGIVAGGPEGGTSEAFFVGSGNEASWLYRKLTDLPEGVQEDWVNHGPGQGWKNYATNTTASESCTALLGGKVIHVAMYATTAAQWDLKVKWSTDDGDNWTPAAPTSIPIPPGGGYVFMNDPSVDFDDSGTAYIIAQAKDPGVARGIFLWTTTNGVNFNLVPGTGPNGELDTSGNSGLDHPWVSVWRNRNGVDEVHVGWVNSAGLRYNHVHATAVDLPAIAQNIQTILPPGATVSAPRLVVSRVDGSAYIFWWRGICRAPVNGNCNPYLGFGDGDYRPDGGSIDVPGTNGDADSDTLFFRTTRNYGIAASPRIANQIYYAFQKSELGNDDEPYDLYFSVITYDPNANQINLGPRFVVDGQDDVNEALPELTVTRDEFADPSDVIFLRWHDWGIAPWCSVGGVEYPKRCYQISEAISTNHGVSFGFHQVLPIASPPTVSDPALLPGYFGYVDQDERFMGDYWAVNGELLHSVHTAVTAPLGGPVESVNVNRGWVSQGYWNNSQ